MKPHRHVKADAVQALPQLLYHAPSVSVAQRRLQEPVCESLINEHASDIAANTLAAVGPAGSEMSRRDVKCEGVKRYKQRKDHLLYL